MTCLHHSFIEEADRFWFSISRSSADELRQVIVQSGQRAYAEDIGHAGRTQPRGARRMDNVRQLKQTRRTPVEILISGQADTDVKDELADIRAREELATQPSTSYRSQGMLSCRGLVSDSAK